MELRRSLLQTTGFLATANFLSLGLNLFTVALVAREFGTSREMDVYAIAISIPESLQYLLMLASLGLIFTPLFIHFKEKEGEQAAWEVATSLLSLLCAAMAIVILVIAFAAPLVIAILAPGFSLEGRQLAVQLTRLISPTLFYYGTVGILLGICYAYGDFRTPALNTVLTSLLALAFFFLFVVFLDWGIRGLIVGRVLNLGVVWLFLLLAVRKLKGNIKLRYYDPRVKEFFVYLPAYVLGAISGQLGLMVNRAFASRLASGSVAALSYGQRIVDVPLTVFADAFGTAFLPAFASQVASNHKEEAQNALSNAIPLLSFVMIPVAATLVVLRIPTVRLLFERGSFDQASTQMTSLVLAGMALGLPARAIGVLITRGLPSFKTKKVPALLSAISSGSNVVLNFVLVQYLGIFGIALASSIADSLFTMVGLFFYRRWLRGIEVKRIVGSLGRIGLASAITAAVIYFSAFRTAAGAILEQIGPFRMGGVLAVGLGCYILTTFLLNVEEGKTIWLIVRDRWLGR